MTKFENQPVATDNFGPAHAQKSGALFGGPAPEINFAIIRVFTPCAERVRLLETMNLTARNAAFGDVILFSPACSNFDQFRNLPNWGEVFRRPADVRADAIGSMSTAKDPNTQAAGNDGPDETDGIEKKVLDLHRGFLRQNPGAKTKPNPTSPERTPTRVNHS